MGVFNFTIKTFSAMVIYGRKMAPIFVSNDSLFPQLVVFGIKQFFAWMI